MGFLGNAANRVRDWVRKDKSQIGAQFAKGSSPLNPSGYDMMQAYGYDVLADALKLEHDLISRFVDYEEMDEYGSINAAIDIMADDSTQPETTLNRTVWVSSKDETVEQIIDDLFHRQLRLDEEIWEIARTVIKYGQDYEEILVTDEGVRGLNFLAPPTVRRIEGPRGELFGFVQDFKGRFGFTPAEFQQIMATRSAAINGTPGRMGGMSGADRAVAFEDWEIVHFRLRGKHRRSVYGHCLSAESRIWTSKGLVEISDIKSGDKVLTRHAGQLRATTVLDTVCSGTKPIFQLKTKHRQLRLTAEHPVLIDRGGKNNVWVPAGEVKPGEKLIIATKMPVMSGPPALGVLLTEHKPNPEVTLTPRGASALRTKTRRSEYQPKSEGLRPAALQAGITKSVLEDLLEGQSSVSLEKLSHLFKSVDLPLFEGAYTLKLEDSRLSLPDFVEPWFAELFGFMIGDGWVTDGQVCFARGVYEDQNEYYEGLLAKTGLPVSRVTNEKGVEAQSYVSSQALCKVFRELGWIGGAHFKRVPTWVFSGPLDLRKAFLKGFIAADGWTTHEGAYQHTELCNKELVRDLKNLIDGLGWTSGSIRPRGPRANSEIDGKIVCSKGTYTLTFHETALVSEEGDFGSEELISLEYIGEEPVYDIEVAGSGHNFIADGLVVHNSILDGARWIWKRMILLEDAAMIYRLQRAPERYAFYVDVGDLPPNEAMAYMNRVRQQHRKKKFLNPSSGKLDLKHEPMDQMEDFFVPVRQGSESTRIEVLGSPSWQSVSDIEYFRDHLFAAMKIPKTYLAQSDGANRGTLSSEDVRFARLILRIQRELRNGLAKVARVHLAALNIDPLAVDYAIHFQVPSAIFELAQLEVKSARADLAGRMGNFVSLYYIQSKIFGMSDDEIELVNSQRDEDAEREANIAANSQSVLQRSVGAATVQGQAQGQVDATSIMTQAGLPDPNAVAAQPPKKENFIRGPLIKVMPSPPKRTYYDTERRLFEGSNKESEKRMEEKLDKLLRTDRARAEKLSEVGHLLKDLSQAMQGRKR